MARKKVFSKKSGGYHSRYIPPAPDHVLTDEDKMKIIERQKEWEKNGGIKQKADR